MGGAWEKLVAAVGEDEARKEMSRRQSKIKHHPGGAFRDKDFAKTMSDKGNEALRKKRKMERENRRKGRKQ